MDKIFRRNNWPSPSGKLNDQPFVTPPPSDRNAPRKFSVYRNISQERYFSESMNTPPKSCTSYHGNGGKARTIKFWVFRVDGFSITNVKRVYFWRHFRLSHTFYRASNNLIRTEGNCVRQKLISDHFTENVIRKKDEKFDDIEDSCSRNEVKIIRRN